MPGRPHHTDKIRSCVEQLLAKGHEESSAYAICVASQQNAGHPIFEKEVEERAAQAKPRLLHLIGATGQIRSAQYEGRDHLVIPVVALMEGVIHAINAGKPELVPRSCLSCNTEQWNGRPIVLGHPTKDGKQISANAPSILAAQGFGVVRNAHVNGSKLCCEAWIDPVKAEAIGAGRMLAKIRAGEMAEVSVGAYVVTDDTPGVYGSKAYQAVWKDLVPDHLAFLPNGIGACSNEMGCGSPRMAMCITRIPRVAGGPGSGPQMSGAKHSGGFPMSRQAATQYAQDASHRANTSGLSVDHHIAAAAHTVAAKYHRANRDTLSAKEHQQAADFHRSKTVKGSVMETRAAEKDTGGSAKYGPKDGNTGGPAKYGPRSAEASELIAFQTLRTLCDQLGESYAAASSLIDQLIAAEAAETSEADDEMEMARLESLRALCMAMYSSVNAVVGMTNDLLAPDMDDMPGMAMPAPSCCQCHQPEHHANHVLGAAEGRTAEGHTFVAAAMKMEDCAACKGSGTKDGNPCEVCDGKGELPLRTAVGARHSAMDREILQTVHDGSVKLGAECPSPIKTAASKVDTTDFTVPVLRAAAAAASDQPCGCNKGVTMLTKEQRAEVITGLVGNKHSGFVAGDEKMLEAASDDRLEGFRVAAAARETEVKAAETTAAETERLRTAAQRQPLTAEEFMQVAPPEIRTLIEQKQADDTARKTDLVARLKTAQGEYAEAELAAMSLKDLERHARMLKIDEPKVSFEGRGLPRPTTSGGPLADYAPPDPYANDLKALQARNAASN